MKTEKLLSILIGAVAVCLVFQGNDISLFLGEARDVLAIQSPYHVAQAINPLSVAFLFAPVSFLPDGAALRLAAFISVSIYAYSILREKRHWMISALLISSPLFLYNVYYANLDWLVVLASFISPIPAFLLALMKPQVGWGVALIAILSIWQRNKKMTVSLVAIEGIVYLISFAWGMRWGYALDHSNWSLFPYGVIVGAPVMFYAILKRNPTLALFAAPFLSPYVGPQSWIVILPAIARYVPNLRHLVRPTDSNRAQTYSYPISPEVQSRGNP